MSFITTPSRYLVLHSPPSVLTLPSILKLLHCLSPVLGYMWNHRQNEGPYVSGKEMMGVSEIHPGKESIGERPVGEHVRKLGVQIWKTQEGQQGIQLGNRSVLGDSWNCEKVWAHWRENEEPWVKAEWWKWWEISKKDEKKKIIVKLRELDLGGELTLRKWSFSCLIRFYTLKQKQDHCLILWIWLLLVCFWDEDLATQPKLSWNEPMNLLLLLKVPNHRYVQLCLATLWVFKKKITNGELYEMIKA